MLIKLLEICSEISHSAKNAEGLKKYYIREIVINSSYIVCMKEDNSLEFYLKKGLLPDGLKNDEKFTNISLLRGQMGMDITIVGSLETIYRIINNNKEDKNILKG